MWFGSLAFWQAPSSQLFLSDEAETLELMSEIPNRVAVNLSWSTMNARLSSCWRDHIILNSPQPRAASRVEALVAAVALFTPHADAPMSRGLATPS